MAAGEQAIETAYEQAIVEYFERYPPVIDQGTVTPLPDGAPRSN